MPRAQVLKLEQLAVPEAEVQGVWRGVAAKDLSGAIGSPALDFDIFEMPREIVHFPAPRLIRDDLWRIARIRPELGALLRFKEVLREGVVTNNAHPHVGNRLALLVLYHTADFDASFQPHGHLVCHVQARIGS